MISIESRLKEMWITSLPQKITGPRFAAALLRLRNGAMRLACKSWGRLYSRLQQLWQASRESEHELLAQPVQELLSCNCDAAPRDLGSTSPVRPCLAVKVWQSPATKTWPRALNAEHWKALSIDKVSIFHWVNTAIASFRPVVLGLFEKPSQCGAFLLLCGAGEAVCFCSTSPAPAPLADLPIFPCAC